MLDRPMPAELTPSRPLRLRRRAEFVATAKGVRFGTASFSVQAQRRRDESAAGPARFGLTVTKKTAPRAVDRNRMRRRLREALRLSAAMAGSSAHDYVIVAREPLLTIPFPDLETALHRAIGEATRRLSRPRPASSSRSSQAQ